MGREARLHPRPEVYPMSGIICSQGGHLISGQMAKAFFLLHRLLAICACLASWRASSRQCSPKRPHFPCISEGGIASSIRAAQFMKALTRIVWRVVGRSTSLRLVQFTKVNSGISSTVVLQRSTLLSKRQLSHACAPIAVKCLEERVQQCP